MGSFLVQLDSWLFGHLNSMFFSDGLDALMAMVTDKRMWILPLSMFAVYAWTRKKKPGREALFAALISVGIVDPLCSQILKPWVGRVRPCLVEPGHYPLGVKGSPSFPSNHAANSFAVAVAIGRALPQLLPVALGLASLVGFSRIYLGFHYPGDILAGALIGALVGFGALTFVRRIQRIYLERQKS